MGLKHIEAVKSVVLLLLVALSIMFTLAIWNYSPNYEPLEPLQTSDIAISEKKTIDEIIKPYKMITHLKDGVLGTVDQKNIDKILAEIGVWQLSDLQLLSQNMDKFDIAQVLRQPSQLTLYFPGEVPLPVYDFILLFEETSIPEATFNRIVIDWSESTQRPFIHFLSEANGVHYRAQITVPNRSQFLRNVVDVGQSFDEYAEIDRGNTPFLSVPKNRVAVTRNTYIQEEIQPSKFRDALFIDMSNVQRSQTDSVHEEYSNNKSFMKIDTEKRTFDFATPTAQIQEIALPSELLLSTIDFINEHSGWTNEYRYSYMNPISRLAVFQLYVESLPVLGGASGANVIRERWGDSQIFQYIRPYFVLNEPLERVEQQLPSGVEVAEKLRASEDLDFDLIEEISPGYYLSKDESQNVYVLEPCWYYLLKGNWLRYVPEENSGGAANGLE